MNYMSKKQLLDEINKTSKLFIEEFEGIAEAQKDSLMPGIDKTPAQMIAYQLGWLTLVKSWDDAELSGETPILPAKGYKWNNLGALYQSFYKTYKDLSLLALMQLFQQKISLYNCWIDSLSEETLFIKDNRNWTKPYPSSWTVARFIHINSVAPFKSFRAKIRKWKKIQATSVE